MDWTVGHPWREPSHGLATGEFVQVHVGCGKERTVRRFLLAMRPHPGHPMSWRLWDRKDKVWMSDDLGTDRDVARELAEKIILGVLL